MHSIKGTISVTTTLRIAATAALLALAACSQAPADAPAVTGAELTLDGAASDLAYVTINAGEIAEVNAFETLSGGVSADGAATVTIDLASVSTGVDIRDERMRDIFFVVSDNPTATVTATLDPAAFEALKVGESTTTTLDGTLALKGAEAQFKSEVIVTRLAADRVTATSAKPVIVDAGALGLTEGLAQLQELAGLPSITPAVPVTFALTFTR